MVDITLIKETITELLSANVDKDTIFVTLKDIGVNDADIEKYYNEVTSPKPANKIIPEETKSNAVAHEPSSEEPKFKIASETSKVEVPKPTTTTDELEEATKDVIDIETQNKEIEIPKSISNSFPSFNNTSLENDSEIKKQIAELEEKLSDIKAQMNGLTKIMKDILEENRNILNRLK